MKSLAKTAHSYDAKGIVHAYHHEVEEWSSKVQDLIAHAAFFSMSPLAGFVGGAAWILAGDAVKEASNLGAFHQAKSDAEARRALVGLAGGAADAIASAVGRATRSGSGNRGYSPGSMGPQQHVH